MIPVVIDQIEQGLSRNISFLDKENFNKLLTLFLTEIQEIEEQTLAIADQRNILTAIGTWLDYIGKIIGEPRSGRSDEEYRAALLLKVSVNISDGTPNNIIDLTKQFTSATDSKIIQYYPAYFFSVLQLPEGASEVGIYNLVNDIKPAGVGFTVVNNEEGNRFVPAWIDEGDNYTGVDYAYLDWVELTPFSVFTGGMEQPLQLSNLSFLEVATSAFINQNPTEGLLAQVII